MCIYIYRYVYYKLADLVETEVLWWCFLWYMYENLKASCWGGYNDSLIL